MKKYFIITPFFVILIFSNFTQSQSVEVTVYHSKHCGCCKKWMAYLERNGFKIISNETNDMNTLKAKLEVPGGLSSCHSAVANGYVIEGHVPASAIRKLIDERTHVKGIAVPGMPTGSPGMEGSFNEAYYVTAFKENGSQTIFMKF